MYSPSLLHRTNVNATNKGEDDEAESDNSSIDQDTLLSLPENRYEEVTIGGNWYNSGDTDTIAAAEDEEQVADAVVTGAYWLFLYSHFRSGSGAHKRKSLFYPSSAAAGTIIPLCSVQRRRGAYHLGASVVFVVDAFKGLW